MRGAPLTTQSGSREVYIVNMNKIVETNGETAIKIVVAEQGSIEIVTAYPINIIR